MLVKIRLDEFRVSLKVIIESDEVQLRFTMSSAVKHPHCC